MSTYDAIEKRLIQALADTESMTPSIRDLARELGCNNRVINVVFFSFVIGTLAERYSFELFFFNLFLLGLNVLTVAMM